MLKQLLSILLLLFSAIIYGQYSDLIDNPDLIFYYDFESTSNNMVEDISHNDFDGNYDDVKDDAATGYWGKAFEFVDTCSTKIWIDYHDDHSPDEVTIMAWIYAETYGNDHKRMEILEKTPCYWINMRNGYDHDSLQGIIRGGIYCSETKDGYEFWRYLDSHKSIPLKEWHHVAFTYDMSTFKMYIDGALDTEGCVNGDVFPFIKKNNVPIVVAGRADTPGGEFDGTFSAHWDGKIDEVILLGKALDGDEIENYFQAADPANIPYTLNENSFTVFPNPIKDDFTIYTGQLNIVNYRIRISNLLGQEVYTSTITSAYTKLNAVNIGNTGVYMVDMINDTGKVVCTKKIIIR